MGYRDQHEALIAERDGLRRALEENAAELEALRIVAEEKEALELELARVREASTPSKAPSGEEVDTAAPRTRDRSGLAVAIVVGTLGIITAVYYFSRTPEDDSRVAEHRATDDAQSGERGGGGRPTARQRPQLQSCVPEGSTETFHVRAVVSDTGVVTSAVVRSTSLGPLVQDDPASTCIEAAVLGQSLPFVHDVTVMLPIQPTLPEDIVWAAAVAHMTRP